MIEITITTIDSMFNFNNSYLLFIFRKNFEKKLF